MKKQFLLISQLFFSFYILIAQCPEDNVSLRSQDEIDNFAADYPDCTIINGNLSISTSTINTPDPIVSLIGLEKIVAVKGFLSILSNRNLNDLNGLQNITTIENGLQISRNNNLKNIDALLGLTTIGESLTIRDNDALENLDGLEHITIIKGSLTISRNDNLVSLAGLQNVTSIGGGVDIGIYSNGNLTISYNDTLSNLKGLQSIATIGGSFEIEHNRNLSNIKDLTGLTTIEEGLRIFSNKALTSLEGLENLTTIKNSLFIAFNSILKLCNTPAICNFLNNSTAFPSQIAANGIGCNDEDEILSSCLVDVIEQNFNTISLFPNPSTGVFKLSLDKTSPSEVIFYLCDTAGQQLTSITTARQNSNLLDYSYLPNGVYYLNIFLKDEILQKKLMILK